LNAKRSFLNKNPNKDKFESRAIQSTFIGYADSYGYRIWIPDDRKVIVARDVKFLEEFHTNDSKKNFLDKTPINKSDKFLDNTNETDELRTTEIEGNVLKYRLTDYPEEKATDFPSDPVANLYHPTATTVKIIDQLQKINCTWTKMPTKGTYWKAGSSSNTKRRC